MKSIILLLTHDIKRKMKDQEYYNNMQHNSKVGAAIYVFTSITLLLVVITLMSAWVFVSTYQLDKLYICEILGGFSVFFGLFGYGYVMSMKHE